MSNLSTLSISWIFRRLMSMSLREIVYRIKLEGLKLLWRLRRPDYQILRKPAIPVSNLLQPEYLDVKCRVALLEEAEHYLNHRWLFFGFNCHEDEIDWHKDPHSNISSPLKFSFSINHRIEHSVGNIKNTWEKNRHHHLTVLGMAFFLTKEERYAEEIRNQLKSWIAQNPYLIGINWTHPLEQGIRLIAWSYLYMLLNDSDYFEEIFGESGFLWKSIYEHQIFIVKTYSVGSSANNHLIGEMAGLFISSSYFPVFNESAKWKSFAREKLEKELSRQTYESGINKELAFSYQVFVLEFCLLSVVADEHAFSQKFRKVLKNMLKFIDSLECTLGFLPNYGDGDEGMALQLQSIYASRSDWLLDLGNKFLETDFADRGSFVPELFGRVSGGIRQGVCCSSLYEEEGFLVYHHKKGDCYYAGIFDFGPLGMAPMAAHGHADALSFTLALNGSPYFVDTGTYCYHDNLRWREYFRSALAHNTLVVDRQDQSIQTGPFLWGRKAATKLVRADMNGREVVAEHDGYAHLGVIHRRTFRWSDKSVQISDQLAGKSDHSVELRFHLHPDIYVKTLPEGFELVGPKGKLLLQTDQSLRRHVMKDADEGGWYSPKFGIKVPTHTIVLSGELSLPATVTNEIII